jgi:methionine-rich copper-binding protein CopC
MKRTPGTAGRIAAPLLSFALLALPVAAASAHGTTITRSDPANGSTFAASPAPVTAPFGEEPEANGGAMLVVNVMGQAISEGTGGEASPQPAASPRTAPATGTTLVSISTAASAPGSTPHPPGQLPATGGSTLWMVEALSAVLVVLGLSEALRRYT